MKIGFKISIRCQRDVDWNGFTKMKRRCEEGREMMMKIEIKLEYLEWSGANAREGKNNEKRTNIGKRVLIQLVVRVSLLHEAHGEIFWNFTSNFFFAGQCYGHCIL